MDFEAANRGGDRGLAIAPRSAQALFIAWPASFYFAIVLEFAWGLGMLVRLRYLQLTVGLIATLSARRG